VGHLRQTMFKTKKLSDIYAKYLSTSGQPFASQDVLDILWDSSKKYKVDILRMFDTAIVDKDTTKLRFCIAASFRDGLDKDYSDTIYKIILDTWHEEHEDLVDIITSLKDERFCEPIFKIAIDNSTYRKFDDENESTLRKCVYALKAIETNKSQHFLTLLTETQNPNVGYALEMYK